MRSANLALRFLLELVALGVLAYWGWQAGTGVVRMLLGVGAPLAFAAIWGVLVAPKASRRIPDPARLLLELVLFSVVVTALVAVGQPIWALVFAAVVAGNLSLMVVLGQRGL